MTSKQGNVASPGPGSCLKRAASGWFIRRLPRPRRPATSYRRSWCDRAHWAISASSRMEGGCGQPLRCDCDCPHHAGLARASGQNLFAAVPHHLRHGGHAADQLLPARLFASTTGISRLPRGGGWAASRRPLPRALPHHPVPERLHQRRLRPRLRVHGVVRIGARQHLV